MSQHGLSWPGLLAFLAVVSAAVVSVACGPRGASRQRPDPYYSVLVEPSVIAPRTPVERAVLGKLGELPAGAESMIAGHKVTAGAPYSAASGRTCRVVVIEMTGAVRHRLACRMGRRWAYVPDAVRQPGEQK